MKFTPDESVIVGQIQKSPVEIVQVIKKRLSGIEYIHVPVYRLGGGKCEKGLCLTAQQWDELIALIEQAKAVELPKPQKKKPAMRLPAKVDLKTVPPCIRE